MLRRQQRVHRRSLLWVPREGKHEAGRPAFDEQFPAAVKAAESLKVLTKAVGGVGAAISLGTSYFTYRAHGDSVAKSSLKAIVATAVGVVAGAVLSRVGAEIGAGLGAGAGLLIPGLGESGISEVVLGAGGAVAGSLAGGYFGSKVGNWVANNLFGW